MRCFRPASRALSHLLRHDPVYHHSSPASLFSRHSPLARAFDDPFFSSPFSSPLYTVYEMRDDNSGSNGKSNTTTSNSKAEQPKCNQEEAKAAESQQQQQQQQQQRPNDHRLARHEDSHRQRWLDRRSNRRHRHHHHHNHPLSLFSPFDSLLSSPFFAESSYQPLEITVDLYSTPTAYQVNAAIPGVRKEDIKLTVEDGVLTIEAERREERGRPAKAASTASSSTANTSTNDTSATTTSTATPAEPSTGAPQTDQKQTVEVEVKADGVETKPALETKAQQTQTQPQQPQQQQEEDDDDVSVHHVESYYGRVQRSLALPEDVNVEALTARYEDGVLKIELPRIEEKKQQVKQISIQ